MKSKQTQPPVTQIAKVLDELQHRHHMTNAQLAKATGLSQQNINSLKKIPSLNPGITSLRALAQVFNITIEQLIGDQPLPLESSPHKTHQLIAVPLLDIDKVKPWLHKRDHQSDKFITAYLPKGHYFASPLTHESAFPLLKPHACLIYDSERRATDKDFVLVCLEKTSKPVLRQYITDGNEVYFKSMNPEFNATLLTDACEILGVVIQIHLHN